MLPDTNGETKIASAPPLKQSVEIAGSVQVTIVPTSPGPASTSISAGQVKSNVAAETLIVTLNVQISALPQPSEIV